MKKSTKKQELVYLLDDDPVFSHALELWFEIQGYRIKTFQNVYSFLKGLKHREPDIVILDFALNEDYEGIQTGDQVAELISRNHNNLSVIMLSAQTNIQVAVDLFSKNIIDYVVKDDQFHLNLKQILIKRHKVSDLKREIRALKIKSKLRLKKISFVLGFLILFWTVYILFV